MLLMTAILCLSLVCVLLLSIKLRRVQESLSVIKEALEDIKAGNLNRRVLAKENDIKEFVESLFEWVKLDAGEQVYHFEQLDFNELSRNIMADWIPTLENSHFEYDIDIPENEYFMKIDVRAYIRILNNLIQNILTHSGGNKLTLRITENESQAQIAVTDNGIGISPSNLPHIFERMYQCDDSRLADGNGLGLAIVKELVIAHKGEIKVESIPSTAFPNPSYT
mgnify:FL=1